MNYFHLPQLTPKHEFVFMPEEEAKHATKVLRMGTGDEIWLLDGQGGKYRGKIYDLQTKRCEVRIEGYELQPKALPFKLHLALAPTKNIDRMEWFVEKAVEIGVDRISFLLTKHSERKEIRLDRLEKVAVAAMKQSGNLYLPKLSDMRPLKELLGSVEESARFIAHVPAPQEASLFKHAKLADTCLLIGAEGGFHDEEVALAQAKGFACVSLSPHRLRTETAAVLACHTIHLAINHLLQTQ